MAQLVKIIVPATPPYTAETGTPGSGGTSYSSGSATSHTPIPVPPVVTPTDPTTGGSPGTPAYCIDITSYVPTPPSLTPGGASGSGADGSQNGGTVGDLPFPGTPGGSGVGVIKLPTSPVHPGALPPGIGKPGGVTKVVTHKCFPAVPPTTPAAPTPDPPLQPPPADHPTQPPTPDPGGSGLAPGEIGFPGTPPNYLLGWNAGAVSIDSLDGDGSFLFAMHVGIGGVVAGFTSVPNEWGVGPASVDWGFKFIGDQFWIAESSGSATLQIGDATTYADGDRFEVRRTKAVIDYLYNDAVVYTSSKTTAATALWAQASLFAGGDTVLDAELVPNFDHYSFSGDLHGTLTTLDVNSQNVDGVFAKLPTLRLDVGTPGGMLPTLVPTFDESIVDDPQEAYFAGVLWPGVRGFGIGQGGQNGNAGMHGVLATTLGHVSDDANYFSGTLFSSFSVLSAQSVTFIIGELTQLTPGALNGDGTVPITGTASVTEGDDALSATAIHGELEEVMGEFDYTLQGFGDGTYRLFAQGHADTDPAERHGFYGTLTQPYVIDGRGGARAIMEVGGYILTASGTTTVMGEAVLTGPRPLLMASGTGTALGRAYLAHGGRYDLDARGGGAMRAALSGYSLAASGHTGATGAAVLRLRAHRYQLVASGDVGKGVYFAGTLGGLTPANLGWAHLKLSGYRLVARGEVTFDEMFEGYSCTLFDGGGVATTHLTSLPFEHIVRLGTKYYGVAADGLYRLGGHTFDGDPIVAQLSTGFADFGEPTLKRPRHLYVAGQMRGRMQAGVTGRTSADVTVEQVAGPGNWRAPLARGIEDRYLSYQLSNLDGQYFEVHELAPEVDVLRRTA